MPPARQLRPLIASALTLLAIPFPSTAYGQPVSIPTPLGLPRLAGGSDAPGQAKLSADAFEVVNLGVPAEDTGGNGTVRRWGGLAYVEIAPGGEWSRKLRRHRAGANYITFTICGSIGTVIRIGGIKIGLAESFDDPSYVAVVAAVPPSEKGEWLPLGYETQALPFDGNMMALIGPVTVKMDANTGLWSIWSSDSLIRDGLAIGSSSATPMGRFTVTAGDGGARISGLAFSDENPVFEDANHNAVPDEFEHRALGRLSSSDASAESKAELKRAWADERRQRPLSQSVLAVPGPDFIPDLCGSDGAPVHGMPNSIRYRTESCN